MASSSQPVAAASKSKVVAALLAFFLGYFGVHGFYLGNTQMGLILLGTTIAGFVLTFLLIGFLILPAVGIVCLVQTIMYLMSNEADFERKYVTEKRWF